MSQEQIDEIEISINQAKEVVALGDALMRLNANADFKLVISDGYFKEEAQRLVLAKASPSMRANAEAVVKSIDAIGELYQYFYKIQTMANMAEQSIADAEQAIEELASGELE